MTQSHFDPDRELIDTLENTRSKILAEACALINGDRQAAYGPPAENFGKIAERWSQLLGQTVQPWQAALMMADLKMARLANGVHRDSFVDAAAYIALAAELADV